MVTLSSQRHDHTAGAAQVKYKIYSLYFKLQVSWLSYPAHKWALFLRGRSALCSARERVELFWI
ncbi:hypothetical protein NM75_14220 [Dickeya fangzhongdai]|nr:hypothetical protein NM75_14220 [Dickeya fangzhongdai]